MVITEQTSAADAIECIVSSMSARVFSAYSPIGMTSILIFAYHHVDFTSGERCSPYHQRRENDFSRFARAVRFELSRTPLVVRPAFYIYKYDPTARWGSPFPI